MSKSSKGVIDFATQRYCIVMGRLSKKAIRGIFEVRDEAGID